MNKKDKSEHSDRELDILSTIWMFSCTDAVPTMTYQGVKYRMGCLEEKEIRDLVKNFDELFQVKVSPDRLNKWKAHLHECLDTQGWIKEEPDENKRNELIDNLTVNDVFYNQFRMRFDSAPVPPRIINWGLAHIEQWRQENIRKSEAQKRRIKEHWIPLISATTALAAVMIGVITAFLSYSMHRQTLEAQRIQKDNEVKLSLKRAGYAELMKHISQSHTSADQADDGAMSKALLETEFAYYGIEPFIEKDSRDKVSDKLLEIDRYCKQVRTSSDPSVRAAYQEKLNESKKELKVMIYNILFPETPPNQF